MNVEEAALGRLRRFRDRNDHAGVVDDAQLVVQAGLAGRLYERLTADPKAAVVLASRTGTGKTVVSLVAALQVLEDQRAIDRICVLAPNVKVAARWRRTARQLTGDAAGVRLSEAAVPGPGQLSVSSVGQLSQRRSRQLPAGTLVILDEAHRGTQRVDGKVYQRLRILCSDRPVLLVSATPYQLSTSGLIAMLSVNHDQQRDRELEHVRALAQRLGDLLRRDTELPVDPSQLERLRTTAEQARATIDNHLINVAPGAFPNTDYRPAASSRRDLRLDGHLDLRLDGHLDVGADGAVDDAEGAAGWPAAYWAARAVPALLGQRSGDTFNRALDSSCEAFWASKVGKALRADTRPEVVALRRLLTGRLGTGTDHPKVRATVRWVAGRAAEGRHVIVFGFFLATQAALAAAFQEALAGTATVVAPTGASIPAAVVARLRRPPARREQPVVLVLTDRFSESIDLDGGRPCLVHHDLPWNPNRLRQRMGRVTRISSGFQRVDDSDILLPVLDTPTDQRLYATIAKRIQLGDQLIPAEVEATLEADEHDLPDEVLEVLAEVHQAVQQGV